MVSKAGVLLVISGPTCAGKDEVMRALLKRNKNFVRLVTTNSRKKREEEQEGVDYYFVTDEGFEKLISQGAFFEWVEYRGHYRGGQIKHVNEALTSGKDVVWRIEARGVKNVRKKVKELVDKSVFVQLRAPIEILQRRAERRKTEDKKWTDWSMDMAKWELDQKEDYDYLVENKEGKLDETVEEVERIVKEIKEKND